MSLSKSCRYEVLRRDNFSCRYCGASAELAPLQVDHVVPRALGGTDDRWNLTAACGPCNSGKSAGMPLADLVRAVRVDEAAYLQAKGCRTVACVYCAVPVAWPEDEDKPIDCERCNAAVCAAYEAGLRVGVSRGAD